MTPSPTVCFILTQPPSQPPPCVDLLALYTMSPDISYSMTFAPKMT